MAMPPEDLQPELALIERMRRGEEAAFVQLYRRHRDRVYRLALLYSASAAIAADVTQDAFMHFIANPGQYDPARGALGAWLCGVARNLARKAAGCREDATDPADLADDTNPHDAHIDPRTPLESILRTEAAEQVRRAIAALAPHYRDVLVLCELADLSYAEAAQLCGIDIGTVRSRLFRARARLAVTLAPYAGAKEAVS
ncbi:MAG TPA: sigma-70 family RNA polymerase sigma factor [Usitatibacter sp.]|nr:sigma-70 family RNA polymerase sigma factor [Usitatibacter sp.]